MGILDKIIENKKIEIKNRKVSITDLEREFKNYLPKDIRKSFKENKINIIAEIKKKSPSHGNIKEVSPKEQATLYEKGGAKAISVLTDKTFFGGSNEDLIEVRSFTQLPILRKDFIVDISQIYETRYLKADIVLLILRVLDRHQFEDFLLESKKLSLNPLVEVFTPKETELALSLGADIIGVNNRDLDDLSIDINRSLKIIEVFRKETDAIFISESGISKKEEVCLLREKGFDGFLIGASLMKENDPTHKLKELMSC